MPYKIQKRGNEFCVIGKDDGKVKGCHPSREKAVRQLQALYRNVPDAHTAALGLQADLGVTLHPGGATAAPGTITGCLGQV